MSRRLEELDDVLDPDEVAAVLKRPRKTVVELCRRGEIPGARKVGRAWRVPAWGLKQMFEKAKEKSHDDLQAEQSADRREDSWSVHTPRDGNETQRRTTRRGSSRHKATKRKQPSLRRADLLRRLSL